MQCLGQSILIEGTVRDSISGEPLPYVNVYLKTAKLGTVTNTQGAFRLVVPKKNRSDSLVISFIGYKSQVLSIRADSSAFLVLLKEDFNILEEVEVTPTTAFELVKEALKASPNKTTIRKPISIEAFIELTHKMGTILFIFPKPFLIFINLSSLKTKSNLSC